MKESEANSKALYELFENGVSERWDKVFDYVLKNKQFKTFYFHKKEHGGSTVKDISSLDAFNEDNDIAEWGGLSSFASRASEIVAKNIPL